MLTIPELAAEALGSHLAERMSRRFGSTDAGLIERVQSAGSLALDCIGNSDALYHNVEHTMLVTLVGYDILRGRQLLMETNASDFAHVIIACLFHDIGYVRGILNGDSPAISQTFLEAIRPAASTFRQQLHVLEASTEPDIDKAFAALSQLRADALVIVPDVFFSSRAEQLGTLGVRYNVPTIFEFKPFAAAGGLLSYGGSETDNYRLVGNYTGRILKGEKPTALPVQQATKVELIINLKTAKKLGITVPQSVQSRADEVIE